MEHKKENTIEDVNDYIDRKKSPFLEEWRLFLNNSDLIKKSGLTLHECRSSLYGDIVGSMKCNYCGLN